MGFVALVMLWCLCLLSSNRPVLGNTLARTTENITSCEGVKPIFETKNVSSNIPDVPVSGSELRVCESPSSCCTREMEDNLRLLVRKDFQGLLHHNSRSLEGLLASTASKIQDHVTELARQSENRTLALFGQVYQHMAVLLREPVEVLYSDILRYLSGEASSSNPFTLGTGELSLEDSVATFFSRLFPLVYHRASPPHRKDFSDDYKSCLRATMAEIQPFGDIPRQLGHSLGKTFEATRVLLQALALGVEVLNSTDALLLADECHVALLRMSYCARCHGLPEAVKPCVGYCLNVLRGCLTQHAADLDLPWNGFVEATERLAAAVRERDLEHVVRALHARITEAIMHTVENVALLEKRVKRACGQARYVDTAETAETAESEAGRLELGGVTVSQDVGDAALATQLRHLLASLGRSRGFYANLVESLCSDDSFAETRDTAECWNGQRVGEYSKTVVSSSLNSQKYNPELGWTQRSPDPKIAQLSDKLRHIRPVMLSQLASAPRSDSLVLAAEGSGSGSRHDEDLEFDWEEQGSGSGEQRTDVADPVQPVVEQKDLPDAVEPVVEQEDSALNSSSKVASWGSWFGERISDFGNSLSAPDLPDAVEPVMEQNDSALNSSSKVASWGSWFGERISDFGNSVSAPDSALNSNKPASEGSWFGDNLFDFGNTSSPADSTLNSSNPASWGSWFGGHLSYFKNSWSATELPDQAEPVVEQKDQSDPVKAAVENEDSVLNSTEPESWGKWIGENVENFLCSWSSAGTCVEEVKGKPTTAVGSACGAVQSWSLVAAASIVSIRLVPALSNG